SIPHSSFSYCREFDCKRLEGRGSKVVAKEGPTEFYVASGGDRARRAGCVGCSGFPVRRTRQRRRPRSIPSRHQLGGGGGKTIQRAVSAALEQARGRR